MTPKRILILTSRTGGGHVSLAEALRDQIAPYLSPPSDIQIVDPQSRLFHFHYRVVSRHALWLWAAEYRLSNTPTRARLSHRLFSLSAQRSLVNLIKKIDPALILSTYAYFSYSVQKALEKLGRTIPLGVLFADPQQLHHAWLTLKTATATLAPTRETAQEAIAAGFDPGRVHITGWPVRQQFYDAAHATTINDFRRKLGLDPNRLTIFLQGGGEGTAKFTQTVENLLRINQESPHPLLQIILATGTNEHVQRRFRHVDDCYVLPFTKEVAPYLASADIIMGKAGPNMLFESVTLGKPFIATTYIPGQETPNLQFIRDHGLGWVALRAEEQYTLVKALATGQEGLEERRTRVERYRRWNTQATESIPALIKGLLGEG